MKRKAIWAVAVVVASSLLMPLAVHRTTAAPAPVPDEPHPVIHQAIDQLRATREILVKEAARDFKGHRAAAVKHIDAALTELHEALEADKH